MLKTLKEKWPLIALAGISTLSVGLVVALLKTTDSFNPAVINPSVVPEQSLRAVESSTVLKLAKQSPEMRGEALSAIANSGANNVEGYRARYLLASDLIAQGKGGSALTILEDLDDRYTSLAPYVLLKQGQAETASGQAEAAQATWTQLISDYPDSAATAEALYQLGQQATPDAAQYWDTLLANVPTHPRSIEVALERLSRAADTQTSNQMPSETPKVIQVKAIAQAQTSPTPPVDSEELSLLKLVAYHGFNQPGYSQALNQLTSEYSSELTPEDWAAIGFGYWENQAYERAGDAYAKAPPTAVSLYRAGRGQARAGKTAEAVAAYQQLNQLFPEAPETADGLLNLANLLPRPAALITLDQVIERFPDRAADALVVRADTLDAMKSPDAAKQARASILSQYSDSEAAAKIRLKNAKANAKKGNYANAIQWAQQLVEAAPQDELAAEGGFWLGKWQTQQNQTDAARSTFEQVIRNHPQAYHAWRSAVYLDWDVGDFKTVRTLMPEVVVPPRRSPLPAGSATLQELYLLGQDQSAWSQWQTEFSNHRQPTVSEQFTDGVLRLGVGDNLNAIFMATSLAWRDDPADQREYQQLKQNPSYWQVIYPFPFSELIVSWAQTRQLNPLLVTGLVRQESRFQPQIESVVGAVGLMQVMPETAAWIGERTGKESYSLKKPEDNVEFGTWFLDFTHEQFGDNSLFAVASYNAGPAIVDEWVKEGDFTNADEFVENIPYPETKGYIDSVFGGYWNYLRLYNPEIAAKVAEL